jgi:hypothetical protein
MDWFKGNFTGKPHRKNGKFMVSGFDFRLNESIDKCFKGTEFMVNWVGVSWEIPQ